MPYDVFQHHDGVVHHEAHGKDDCQQREVVDAVVAQVHYYKGNDDGDGQRQAGDDGGGNIPQEDEDHQHHQHDGEQEGELDLVDRVADRDGAVVECVQPDGGGDLLAQLRQQLADAVDQLHGVGARLAVDGQLNAALVVEPVGGFEVLHAVDDTSQRLHPHGMTVTVGNDKRPVGFRRVELSAGPDGEGALFAFQFAGRQVDVAGFQGLLHFVQPYLAGDQLAGVKLGTYRVLLCAEHLDLRYAVDHGDALRNQRVSVLVDHVERQGRRADGYKQHRLIRGVGLAQRGQVGHVVRQTALGARDHRLDILSCCVNVAIQRKLQGNGGASQGAGGGHGVDAGDGGELAFQRGCYRGSHGFRAGAVQIGGHHDGGEIDIGQIADREQPVAADTENDQGQHDQCGHNRAADEYLADVHKGNRLCVGRP